MAVLVFAVAAPFITHAGDIILNGDFHDGTTHWHGDGQAVDGTPGLSIELKSDRWTAVYQRFSAECKTFKLKITYSISDDCTLLTKKSADDLVPSFTSIALERATGLANHIYDVEMQSGQWVVMAVDPSGYNTSQQTVYLNNRYGGDGSSSSGSDVGNPRTFTATMYHYAYFQDQSLCLAFPPGQGTITITKIEAIPPPK